MNQFHMPSIGIITALPHEYAAVKVLLNATREVFIPGRGTGRRYTLGEMPGTNGSHVIALSLLVDMGNNSAAMRASRLLDIFPTVQTVIMVGIAGGVPSPDNAERHVRLGDIVISDHNGVVQYDLDKEGVDITEHRHRPRPPSARLLEAVRLLQANELLHERPWDYFITQALAALEVQRPPETSDVLTDARDPRVTCPHPPDDQRLPDLPRVFIGTIAAANKLLKNPLKRDLLRNRFGAKAIEMEGSGIADATWDCSADYLVIRGICDYCDQNKGDHWQRYAAIVPAAYLRALLNTLAVYSTPLSTFESPTIENAALATIYYSIDDALTDLHTLDCILAEPSLRPIDCDQAIYLAKRMESALQDLWDTLGSIQPIPHSFELLYHEVKPRRFIVDQRLQELVAQLEHFRTVCRLGDYQTQTQREVLRGLCEQARKDFTEFSQHLPGPLIGATQPRAEPSHTYSDDIPQIERSIADRNPHPTAATQPTEAPPAQSLMSQVPGKARYNWDRLAADERIDDLANYLLRCESMSDAKKRDQIVKDLGSDIGSAIDHTSSGIFDVTAIVRACRNRTGGLDMLIHRVYFYERSSNQAQELLTFLKEYRLS
jgi:nucleoside phosphorylase